MTKNEMMISNQLLVLLFIVLPPALAFLYIVSIQCFLAGWHECSWTYLAKPITVRFTLLIVAIAIVATLPTTTTNNEKDDFIKVILPYLFPAIFMTVLSITAIYRSKKIFIQGPVPQHKDMTGKVVLITGSNAGIGKETARQLLKMGATVIMACRSEKRAKSAIDDILISFNDEKDGQHDNSRLLNSSSKSAKDRLIFLKCDVSDFKSVRNAVSKFKELKLPLHILVNNAGIMMGQRRTVSGDDKGLELTMACNHLGHFLLTNLLLPTMRLQEDSRVIIVTSSTYALATEGIDLKDLNCDKKRYTMFTQYAQSKLANILMGKELLRREEDFSTKNNERNNFSSPVSVFMVHPGLVRTDVVRNMPWYLKYPNVLFSVILTTLQKTPEAGAYTSVFCASSNEVKQWNGEYFSNSKVMPTNQHASDATASKDLWKLSENLVGLNK